ncbi:hypothetical protein Golax_021843, partial [Gossypium laxum]|nr:hypothetical protein [Gossypium laxum]
ARNCSLVKNLFLLGPKFGVLQTTCFGSVFRGARIAVVVSTSKNKKLLLLSVATLQIVKDQPHQKSNRKLHGGIVRHFDNNDPRYSWLLVACLAEECLVLSSRLYR